jgi:hypothetical protein
MIDSRGFGKPRRFGQGERGELEQTSEVAENLGSRSVMIDSRGFGKPRRFGQGERGELEQTSEVAENLGSRSVKKDLRGFPKPRRSFLLLLRFFSLVTPALFSRHSRAFFSSLPRKREPIWRLAQAGRMDARFRGHDVTTVWPNQKGPVSEDWTFLV